MLTQYSASGGVRNQSPSRYLFRDGGDGYADAMIDLHTAGRDALIRLVAQHETIAQQERTIAELRAVIATLDATVAQLTERVGELQAAMEAARDDAAGMTGRPQGPCRSQTRDRQGPPPEAATQAAGAAVCAASHGADRAGDPCRRALSDLWPGADRVNPPQATGL